MEQEEYLVAEYVFSDGGKVVIEELSYNEDYDREAEISVTRTDKNGNTELEFVETTGERPDYFRGLAEALEAYCSITDNNYGTETRNLGASWAVELVSTACMLGLPRALKYCLRHSTGYSDTEWWYTYAAGIAIDTDNQEMLTMLIDAGANLLAVSVMAYRAGDYELSNMCEQRYETTKFHDRMQSSLPSKQGDEPAGPKLKA